MLLVDEMSLGLAPLVVEALFDTVRRIASDHGAAIVIVEQHVSLALNVADEAAVLHRGTMVLRGVAHELRHDTERIERLPTSGTSKPRPPGRRAEPVAPLRMAGRRGAA